MLFNVFHYAMINSNKPMLFGCLVAVTFIVVLICISANSWYNSAQQNDYAGVQVTFAQQMITAEQFYTNLGVLECPMVTCSTATVKVYNKSALDATNPTVLVHQANKTKDDLVQLNVPCVPKSLLKQAYDRRYIGCNFWATGGIGNQIWRFASIYGIGRYTGREPFFESKNTDQMKNLLEIALIFPMMHEVLHVKSPPEIYMKKYHFADDCCKFDDPKKLVYLELVTHLNVIGVDSRLLDIKSKYIKIAGDYMQSYKFFHLYRDEIRKIFKCGLAIKLSIQKFANNLFGNDSTFKLCAHIRRGDFIEDIMLESKEDFILPALKYALKDLQNRGHHNVSLIFIGNDQPFVLNLNIKNYGFQNIYISQHLSRGEDMCLGINYCDAMVMTASGSTFGWWISYLMKPGAPIYYNSQITDNADFTKDVHDFDIFPPDWIMLTVKNNVAVKETQWWHQRRGQKPDLPSKDLIEWV